MSAHISLVWLSTSAKVIPDAADLVTVDVIGIGALAITLIGGQNVAAAVLDHRLALC